MSPVTGINNGINTTAIKNLKPRDTGQSFSDRFKDLLEDVNTKQHEADESAEKVVKGELGIHEGMLSVHEADISFRYLVKVREKVMQAYNEIRKMPV